MFVPFTDGNRGPEKARNYNPVPLPCSIWTSYSLEREFGAQSQESGDSWETGLDVGWFQMSLHWALGRPWSGHRNWQHGDQMEGSSRALAGSGRVASKLGQSWASLFTSLSLSFLTWNMGPVLSSWRVWRLSPVWF